MISITKNKYTFYTLYAINIICLFGFGSIRIPGSPLNFYQITSVLIIFYCAVNEDVNFWDKYQVLFWIFYLIFGISSFLTGYEEEFLSTIVRKIFGVVSVYWSTKYLISKYQTIIPIIIPVVIVGTIDSIMTICQCYGLHYFDSLSMLLGTSMKEEKLEFMIRRDITFGVSVNGIYLTDVLNGHFLLFFFMISLFFLKDRLTPFRLLFPALVFAGLFFCQERSAFFLSILGLGTVIFFLIKRGVISEIKILWVALILFFAIAIQLDFTSFADSSVADSRVFKFDTTSREALNDQSINFILSHPLLGGHFLYIDMAELPPHNIFYDSIISGGILGGLILLYMICTQIAYIVKSLKLNIRTETFIFSMTFICLLLDSFSHNTGYIQADSLTWMSWAIAMCYIKIDSKHYYDNIY